MFSMRMGMGLGAGTSAAVAFDAFSAASPTAEVMDIGVYRYYLFRDPGTHTLSVSAGTARLDILAVGAGASGGGRNSTAGGGGGAGGLVTGEIALETGDTLSIAIGAGGAAATLLAGSDGGPTTITKNDVLIVNCAGGGKGGRNDTGDNDTSMQGGSGGGAGGRASDAAGTGGKALQTTPATAPYTAGFGNAGGSRALIDEAYSANFGAGGGGAGGAGQDTVTGGGAGGAYKELTEFAGLLLNNPSGRYAAGGAGGNAATADGLGGLSVTSAGLSFTGSGGGGRRNGGTASGKGADGIVILRVSNADLEPLASPRIIKTYLDADGYLWVRSQFDASYDVLLKYDANFNMGVMPLTEYLIPYGNAITDRTTGAVTVKLSGDDHAAIGVCGTSTGSGHGPNVILYMTHASGHGLDFADIGNIYVDASAAEFVLVSIVSATVACFIAKTLTGYASWSRASCNASNVLTLKNSDPAESVTFATQASNYFTPSICGINNNSTPVKTWVLDDETEIAAETYYTSQRASFRSVYQEASPWALRDFCEANAGTFTANPSQAQINSSSIEKYLEIDNTYIFGDYGSVVFEQTIALLKNVTMGDVHAGVVEGITATSKKAYAPGVKPLAESGMADINREVNTYATAGWELTDINKCVSVNEPMHRLVMLCDDTLKRAFAHGIDFSYGDGTHTNRKAQGLIWSVTNSPKSRPRILYDIGAKTTGYSVTQRIYRKVFKQGVYGTSTAVYWVTMGDYHYIYIDYHATADENITLPRIFWDKAFTRIETQGTVTAPAASGTIGADGTLAVNVTDWGHTILKVSAT
jgi:hypothetical protein